MLEFMLADVKIFDYSSEDVVVLMPMYGCDTKDDSNSFTLE